MMRWLVIVVAVLAALWSGWWFAGAAGVRRGVEAAAAEAEARGWTVAWDDLSVVGFPNRFDTTLDAPRLEGPGGAWGWSAPFVQVFALSYRPNHLIAVAPNTQTLGTPFGPVEIASEDMRASLVVSPDPALPLERLQLTAEAVAAEGGLGAVAVDALRLALREAGAPHSYDVAFGAEGLVLPEALMRRSNVPGLPAEVGALELDGTVALDRAIDRTLDAAPAVEALDLRAARVRWGGIDVTLSGRLEAGPEGLAEGALAAEIADVPALARALEGALDPARLALARRFLVGFAPEGRPDAARVDLQVRGGVVALGPFELLMLPPLSVPGS
ncbi:DUF2125 domain-containing protein [Jannaschia sp. W003]|uniref:DUF2125 domain-containing protein n=1 Tax=Jannaschia sp. W003 TaxID=2867012 RepID=UPI0021A966D4|nr:DUF2125 domain-containing protein [Jannaschia sp. W003]UWQ22483.1 DUF2125 domain-containing protein [Jannaschia sp. W003]